jgi:hypothetical protein
MKNFKQINWPFVFLLVAVVLVLFYWFKGCASDPEVIKAKTPESKGTFAPVKPVHDTVFLTKFVKSKPIQQIKDTFAQAEINRLLQEYNSLNDAFARVNDSLQQIIYSKSIAPKLFSHHFDNDTLSAWVKGIVANGEVEKLKLDYTIKSRSVEVKVPQVKFRLLGGVEAGLSRSFDQFNAKVNLGFQNKKGSIISVSADTDERFYVGYTVPIFTIRK